MSHYFYRDTRYEAKLEELERQLRAKSADKQNEIDELKVCTWCP